MRRSNGQAVSLHQRPDCPALTPHPPKRRSGRRSKTSARAGIGHPFLKHNRPASINITDALSVIAWHGRFLPHRSARLATALRLAP
jgi:hypothetical protein